MTSDNQPSILLLSAKRPDPDLDSIQSEAEALGFSAARCTTIRLALHALGVDTTFADNQWRAVAGAKPRPCHVVVAKLGNLPQPGQNPLDGALGVHLLRLVRLLSGPQTFFLFHSQTACNDPKTRWYLFQSEFVAPDRELTGCNMVSTDMSAILQQVLKPIAETVRQQHTLTKEPRCACPWCGASNLTAQALWTHAPLYHINNSDNNNNNNNNKHSHHGGAGAAPSQFVLQAKSLLEAAHLLCPQPAVRNFSTCSLCQETCRDLQKHIFSRHGPVTPAEAVHSPQHLLAYSLVVCVDESQKQMVLVQERSNVGFWLPGGHVDPGETLARAAVREAEEEAGVRVGLTGVLQIQYHPVGHQHVRLRVIFLAKQVGGTIKTVPDYESTGATWASLEQIAQGKHLVLRSPEPQVWAKYLLDGGVVHSLGVLVDRER